LFLGKRTKTAAIRAAVFDSNMHQIVCRLGLRPRPHWWSLQRSPDPLAVIRGPTSKGRGEEGRERKGEGTGGGREGEERGGRGMRRGEGRGGREFVLCPIGTKQMALTTAVIRYVARKS